MPLFNTIHKRKSALITTLFVMLLMLVIFTFGLQYTDPPEEYGVAVAFGFTENDSQAADALSSKKTISNEVVQDVATKEVLPDESANAKEIEPIITNENADDFLIEKKEKVSEENNSKEVVKKEVVKPKPSKEIQDALNNLLNAASSKENTSSENKSVKNISNQQNSSLTNKGSKTGVDNSDKYYSNTKGTADSNYSLLGRNALFKPKEQPDCQEEGTVVVSVEVDRKGNVIRAFAGEKGTTNSAACLLKPAKEAALKTKWSASSNASKIQIGTIIYKFSLSK